MDEPANPRVGWQFHPSSGVGAPSGGAGQAISLGSLSVPPSWTPIASVLGSATRASAFTIDAADPVVPERLPGRTFQQTLMAMVTGCDWLTARMTAPGNGTSPDNSGERDSPDDRHRKPVCVQPD
ncbi:PE/PPE C-terminal domain-containing protein [Mycobacterium europaeum]